MNINYGTVQANAACPLLKVATETAGAIRSMEKAAIVSVVVAGLLTLEAAIESVACARVTL